MEENDTMRQEKVMEQYSEMELQARKIIDKTLDCFVHTYPHVSDELVYKGEDNTLWTSSFFPGMVMLAYQYTKDEKYLAHVEEYLDSFEDRAVHAKHVSHDMGFLYTLSCVSVYKLLGTKRAYKVAHIAADLLAERYNAKGGYIQAWGDMGIKYPDVKIIIDCMMNLPLLYWTGKKEYIDIAYQHAKTSAKTLIRPDYSSYHTYLMNPDTGEAVCGKTHQGYQDESTWARGQAWAVYGFALSYSYTKDPKFLETSKECAEVFIKNLPKDYVPYWDFAFSDENPDIRDTSAAAIFCCGLLELCNYVSEKEKVRYEELVDIIMISLYEQYSTRDNELSNGVLKEGMYHRHDGFHECVIWGDYFYYEAIIRRMMKWERFW